MKWIKCSDKLPDNADYFIIRLKNPSVCCEYFIANIFKGRIIFREGGVVSGCIDHSDTCGSHFIAWKDIEYWMPFPQLEK